MLCVKGLAICSYLGRSGSIIQFRQNIIINKVRFKVLFHKTGLVYGIVGSAFMDALDIFELAGIRFVSVQHEQNAVHRADGYSRVTNSPSK